MNLAALLEGLQIARVRGGAGTEIADITYDSRSAGNNFLFVALRGNSVDGHDYIQDAIDKGATAILAEDAVEKSNAYQRILQKNVAYIEVPDSRESLGRVSAAFYGHPSRRLSVTGITGTNGKTTTSFITKSILEAGGNRTGLLGTICYMTGKREAKALNTTPESLDLQRYLHEMVASRMGYAVIEVSSHALDMKRVAGCVFQVAAFTNFSQDHLDYHGSMENYFHAKRKIFDYLDAGGTAVLNSDDPRVAALAGKLTGSVLTCGMGKGAMIRAGSIKEYLSKVSGGVTTPSGVTFEVQTPDERFQIESPFVGQFNIQNVLMSVGIARSLNIKKEDIQQGVSRARPVAGRFELLHAGQPFVCIVDYAHTDDALRKLISEARHFTKGRVITVFGCGGDRDRSKRPLMGAAASELSDAVIVTSDNPRTEDPEGIISDILPGIKKGNHRVVSDRAGAIREAVAMAGEGDTVIVAGKGHEDYQEIMGTRYHFSDREILEQEIRRLQAGHNADD